MSRCLHSKWKIEGKEIEWDGDGIIVGPGERGRNPGSGRRGV